MVGGQGLGTWEVDIGSYSFLLKAEFSLEGGSGGNIYESMIELWV